MKIGNGAVPMFAMSCLFFSAGTLSAQTDTLPAVSTSASIDLVSRFVWRGQDVGSFPCIQPGLAASWKNFTVGTWGNYSLTGAGIQEIDFYVSKTIGFVSVAIWDYWSFEDNVPADLFNFRNQTTTHLLEAQVQFCGGETLPFNFLASWFFHGSDPSRSVYLELQYLHSSNFADLAVFAGYQAKGQLYASNPAFVNLGCTVKKTIAVTDRFSLPVNLSLIINPTAQSAWLVAGITL